MHITRRAGPAPDSPFDGSTLTKPTGSGVNISILQTVLLDLARGAAKIQASPASAFRDWSCQAVPSHTIALSPSFAALAATSSAFGYVHYGQVEGTGTGAAVKWCVHLEFAPAIIVLCVACTTNLACFNSCRLCFVMNLHAVIRIRSRRCTVWD